MRCSRPYRSRLATVRWVTRLRHYAQRIVRKYVPDPRDDPLTETPIDAESYKRTVLQQEGSVRVGIRPGQSVEDYMVERDREWLSDQKHELAPLVDMEGLLTTKDGMPFVATGVRDRYMSVEAANARVHEPSAANYVVDEETQLLRRQLQLESEVEYRKFVAETKRNDLLVHEMRKRRRPHPSDPNYNPFQHMPGYRPQDSVALAQWLQRQRESGKSASGLSLQTKEGQERYYNEQKMTTQYHANPFASRVEIPPGMGKLRVTAYSPDSIFINDKEVIGSCIVTNKGYYHWNVNSFNDVNERTMALLLHLYPVPEVVFLGTGRNLYFVDEELRIAFQKRGTVIHCLTTPNACGHFGMQLSMSLRTVLAVINPIPVSGYGVECFGDFIENDNFALSDSQLGITPIRQYVPQLYTPNKVAEKYRDVQGTGIGPQYHRLSDGRLVRPGTSGTRLRPMIEPGEDVNWERLPSYYHWYPKETLEDYIENTTWREVKGRPPGDYAERRMHALVHGDKAARSDEQVVERMPWDAAGIPIARFPHERDDDEAIVEDPKTGRIIGMERDTYERWLTMMGERRAGKPESDPVEYDQERYVTSKDGVMFDLSKVKHRPIFQGRWNPQRTQSTGRSCPVMV